MAKGGEVRCGRRNQTTRGMSCFGRNKPRAAGNGSTKEFRLGFVMKRHEFKKLFNGRWKEKRRRMGVNMEGKIRGKTIDHSSEETMIDWNDGCNKETIIAKKGLRYCDQRNTVYFIRPPHGTMRQQSKRKAKRQRLEDKG